MTINLHNDLASSGWHSSIMTTYSVDPAFYDMYVERRLRTYGVKNNILMADARMLKIALNALPEAFAAAGVRYAVVPVSVAGAFHPKVHLRLAENKARLVIGSANATAAGWGKNQEVVTRLNWSWRADEEDDNAAMAPLMTKAYIYLAGWLRNASGEAVRYKLQMIERQAPWLRDIDPSKIPVTLADGSAVDLLCERGADSPSMLKQFSGLAADEEVRRLVVVSPYWDVNLRGFHDLRAALGNPLTLVALNPRRNAFPVQALRDADALKFVAVDDTASARFIHAKILIAQTCKADHVLFGSANCSDDALGRLGGVSRNAEVCVYRRLPYGRALERLGIDLSKSVPRAEILPPIPITASAATAKSSAAAGAIELCGQALTWWPPSAVSAQGALIELGGISLTPCEGAGGKWTAQFTATPIFPLIARIRYHDGLLSDPVIVHFETALRKAAPGHVDPRLNDALDKARGPEGDLMELAAQVQVIFEHSPHRVTAKGPGGRTGTRQSKDRKVVEYESEQEFRNAMQMQPGTGKTGRTDNDEPAFQNLLAIIGRGIAGSLPQGATDDDEENKALLAGDAEDNADELRDRELDEDEEQPKAPPQQNPPPAIVNKRAQVFTAADVWLRRKQLVKVFDLFDTLLKSLAKDPSLITSRLAIQTLFVFRLMRYGVAHVHKISDGGSQKLMVMSEGGFGTERRLSFVFNAAMILKQIWTGDKSIASQIRLDPRQSQLPDDIFEFIVVSRWALGRAYLESKKHDENAPNGKPSLLTLGLSRIAKDIYAATAAMGQVDATEERRTISGMDCDLGCTSAQTEELMRCLRTFSVRDDSRPTTRRAG